MLRRRAALAPPPLRVRLVTPQPQQQWLFLPNCSCALDVPVHVRGSWDEASGEHRAALSRDELRECAQGCLAGWFLSKQG